MRLSLFAIAAIATSVSASSLHRRQDAQAITQCIAACATGGTVDPGNCTIDDNACLCKNTAFVEGMKACFPTQCPDIAQAVIEAATQTCAEAGVTESGSGAPEPTAEPSGSVGASAEPSATPAPSGSASASGSHSASHSATAPSGRPSGSASQSGAAPAQSSGAGNGAAALGVQAASGVFAIGLAAVLAL